MKRRTLTTIGVAGTVLLMAILAYCVLMYMDDPENEAYMMAMGALSTGLMVFLVVFGVVYGRGGQSASEMYAEMYQGICSVCGSRFGEDGVCPKCGRRRPRSD